MVGDFFLTTWFLQGMKWLYSNFGSVFLTIVISTLLLKLLTLFSDIKSRKYSADMAKLQPQIQRLQKRYANDPQKLQAEQSKLMKKSGVSMLSGCLPLLITMPLFFCFIAAFRFWGYEEVIRLLISDNPAELFASYRWLWVNNIWQPDNGMLPVIQDAATFLKTKDLQNLLYLQQNPQIWDKLIEIGVAVKNINIIEGVSSTSYSFLTTDAAIAAYNNVLKPCVDLYAGHNNGWFVLPVLSGALNLLYMWVSQKGQPQQSGQAGQTGKMMMYMMPVMSFVFCLTSNAAFAIYWTVSSMVMLVINLILNKLFPREDGQDLEVKK